jgi:hypothetical protein
MRRSCLFLIIQLLICAALFNGVALAHVHDASTPGLQNAQCPYADAGPRSIGLPASAPDIIQLHLAPAPVSVAADAPAPQQFTATASPRGPPHA